MPESFIAVNFEPFPFDPTLGKPTRPFVRWLGALGPLWFGSNLQGSKTLERKTAFRTHYDNLKVSVDAPPEVIRAAYKALSLKLHPDRNSDPRSAEVMAIVNRSYEILADPVRRARHDKWIRDRIEEAETIPQHDPQGERDKDRNDHNPQRAEPSNTRYASSEPPPQVNVATDGAPSSSVSSTGFLFWAGMLMIVVFATVVAFVSELTRQEKVIQEAKSSMPSPAGYQSTYNPSNSTLPSPQLPLLPSPLPARPVYVRPATAPNGANWPITSAYVDGYEVANSDGHSEVTIDNTGNASDVFLKLVELTAGGRTRTAVRHVFISAHGKINLESVTRGHYDVRYRDLDTGGLSRSDPFELQQFSIEGGIRYSHVSMTLFKVRNGNMQTHSISEGEF